MKPRRDNKKITKAERRRQRNRLVSILTAAVVFFTTYAMVLPAVTMEGEVAAQEPGIELAQPVAEVPEEPAVQEPVASEPAAAEPAAEPLVAETVAEPVAAGDASGETVEIQEEAVPAAAPEAVEIVTPEPAAAEDANAAPEDPAAEPAVEENSNAEEEAAVEDPASEEDAEEKAEEETEEKKEEEEKEKEEEETKLAASPLVCDGPDYVARAYFGPEAALPEGTTLIISEYGMGGNDYLAYKGYLINKLRENGVAEEDLEEAVSALRLFGVVFKDKDGVRILPASAVDVEIEYKNAAQVVTDETLYAVTFRTDDGQPARATLVSGNGNGRAAVEAPNGFIQKLYVQAWQAQDYHTNPVIGQLMLKTIEKSEEADTDLITLEEAEEQEEVIGVGADAKPVWVEDGSYCLYLTYGPEAGIPEDAKFVAVPVTESHPEYEAYKDRALGAVEDQTEANPVLLGLFDLTIYDANDNIINPTGLITISAELDNALDEVEDVYAVHFVDSSIVAEEETATAAEAELEVLTVDSTDGAATFETDGLSVIGIVGTETITGTYLTADGETYTITVTYGPEAGIPAEAELQVSEIPESSAQYPALYKQASEAVLNGEEKAVPFARFFDISIMANGKKIQPMVPVDVKITFDDAVEANQNAEFNAVHITEDGTNVIQVDTSGETIKNEKSVAEVDFSASGFSIYGITFTVDFTYMNYTFKLSGGSSILLSELFEALNIVDCVEDVQKVEFSNEEHLRIVSLEGDWRLESLKSFGTPETLTVTIRNGNVYLIDVTDPTTYSASLTTKISMYVSDMLLYLVDGLTPGSLVSVDNIIVNDPNNKGLICDHATKTLFASEEFELDDNVTVDVTYSYKNEEDEILQNTITIKMASHKKPGGEIVYYQETSITHGQRFEDNKANEWQTDEDHLRFINEHSKIVSTDQAVRIQKNVIPTGIENEFLVYLGVDVSEGMVLDRIMESLSTVYTPSNPEPNYGDIWGNNNAAKAENAAITGKDGNMRGFVLEQSAQCPYKWYINVTTPTGETFDFIRYAEFNRFNNGHLVMQISGPTSQYPHGIWITVGSAAKSTGAAQGDGYVTALTLDADAIQMIMSYLGADVDLGSVFDSMGTQSITNVVEQGHTELIGASVTVNDYLNPDETGDGKSISWDVGHFEISGALPDDTVNGYYQNVAELLYKVTLDVTEDGFVSGEWYNTNTNAQINYIGRDETPGTAVFPNPSVRGSVYSFEFEKEFQDAEGNTVTLPEGKKATFTLASDNPAFESISKDTSGGKVTFDKLPWGKYTLTETPPEGYRAGEGNPWTMYIGYTGDGTSKYGQYLTPASPGSVTSEGAHYLNTEWATGGVWRIVNKWNKITFTKNVDVQGNLNLVDVDHTIYIALWHGGNDGDYLRDDQGNIITKEIVITNGVPEPMTVTFENIDTDFYDIDELVAVDGTRLRVGDEWENSEGDTIMLAAIRGNNDADLTISNTADVTLTNVYSHPTTIDFTANKKWADAIWKDITSNPPSGATVTFEIYRCLEGEDPDTDSVKVEGVEPIVLDGATDGNGEYKAWEATFKDLPREDGAGHKYVYSVKEIACSDADYECYANQYDTTPMGDKYLTSIGGYIWNKQKTTSITVKKEDNNNIFLPGAKFKFYKVETDDAGTHDVQIGDEFAVPEDGFTFNDLISGTYKLVETKAPDGYIILTSGIVFKVNATGNGDVIQWLDGEKPDDVKDLSGTNNNTITIINTPGSPLPNTGGSGTLLYTLGGIALILVAALMYGFRMRRRERRLEE